jgi:hypothetical protein
MPINPSYLGAWEWEDCSSRPAWPKSFQDSMWIGKGWVEWHVPVIPASQKPKNRILVQASLDKKQSIISKIASAKRGGGMAQAVEHLPSKCISPECKSLYWQKKLKNKKCPHLSLNECWFLNVFLKLDPQLFQVGILITVFQVGF